jgi:hypothetical protein
MCSCEHFSSVGLHLGALETTHEGLPIRGHWQRKRRVCSRPLVLAGCTAYLIQSTMNSNICNGSLLLDILIIRVGVPSLASHKVIFVMATQGLRSGVRWDDCPQTAAHRLNSPSRLRQSHDWLKAVGSDHSKVPLLPNIVLILLQ